MVVGITATLVNKGKNRLRYLLVCPSTSGTFVTITSSGAPSADFLTDSTSNNGTIRNLAKAFTNGYGTVAAGAFSVAQSRAIWLADNTGANVGNVNIQRGQPRICPRAGPAKWQADCGVDLNGSPTMTVTADATGEAYLDVYVPGAIGS